jgi:hypothetical protein
VSWVVGMGGGEMDLNVDRNGDSVRDGNRATTSGLMLTGGGEMDLNADRNGDGVRDGNGVTTSGLMLTSEREVDERLRRMNGVFLGSLEGQGRAGLGRVLLAQLRLLLQLPGMELGNGGERRRATYEV